MASSTTSNTIASALKSAHFVSSLVRHDSSQLQSNVTEFFETAIDKCGLEEPLGSEKENMADFEQLRETIAAAGDELFAALRMNVQHQQPEQHQDDADVSSEQATAESSRQLYPWSGFEALQMQQGSAPVAVKRRRLAEGPEEDIFGPGCEVGDSVQNSKIPRSKDKLDSPFTNVFFGIHWKVPPPPEALPSPDFSPVASDFEEEDLEEWKTMEFGQAKEVDDEIPMEVS